MTMAGKLDDISEAIGALRAGMSALERAVATLADQQVSLHRDNQRAIGGLGDNLAAHARKDEAALAEIDRKLGNDDVILTRIQPQLAALQANRARILWFAGLGLIVLVMVGRAIEIGLGAAATWLFSHWH